jgi:predicted nucleic acid-binding protein
LFVVDASITLAWCFEDEANEPTDAVLRRLASEGGIAPAHWPLEVANGLRSAARSGRVDAHAVARARGIVLQLPIEVRPVEPSTALGLIDVAGAQDLTVYDAAYLGLAEVLGLAVATLDARLIAACRAMGIGLVQPD